jgi:hypothetical protein
MFSHYMEFAYIFIISPTDILNHKTNFNNP